MYIDTVPNRNSRPAVLLREAWRDGRRIRKRTLANLSDWPDQRIQMLRRVLRGEILVRPEELFETVRTIPHGHVEAVLGSIRRLGLESLISSTPSGERDLVVAMIAERLIHPCSKLATTRLFSTTTLAEELSIPENTDVDELYEALDWLLWRQERIEAKLAKRHLPEGAKVLYDVSSSYYHGQSCPLARLGHDRDGKRGLPIIVYGLLTDAQGRPVSVNVYPGNTGDPATVADQVEKLQKRFGLSRLVFVGDRGMLTQARIEDLRRTPGVGWISALRSCSIRRLIDEGPLQASLFEERNLAEISSPAYPGERLIACFNPLLAEQRRGKRQELLEATEKELGKIAREVARRTKTPLSSSQIGLKAGRVINRYKVAKHFRLTIAEKKLEWVRREESIQREAELDGIYVIRTSEAEDQLSADDVVRGYKNLARVEQAFRCLKQVDLRVRPIRHRTEDHVRAHIFLCMLAYYVEWHMRRALAPLLFEDENVERDRKRRDPVAPAEPSASVKRKKAQRRTVDGLPIHDLHSLLAELATRSRCLNRVKSDSTGPSFSQITPPTPLQQRALELLGLLPVTAN